MRSRPALLILFILFSLHSLAQLPKDLQRKTDSIFAANPQAIGVLIHVEAPDRNLSCNYAVGNDGKNATKKLEAHQPLLIASTTKTYVSAAVLRLVEKKKLKLDQPIKELLTAVTVQKLSAAGYDLNAITVKHLLSHTSGIRDYVDENYFKFISENKQFNWTRELQLERSASLGAPLGKAGSVFKYADVNYVLLTEIIEQKTGKPFYTAMRRLLKYRCNGLKSTWFINLEQKPKNTLPMVKQYWSTFSWNIPDLNPSWDLYGGGGIASTVSDMAHFYQKLFNGKIVKNRAVLQQMYTDVPPDFITNYCLGIRKIKVHGITGYNHGGGLGTDVTYFPELNATISVAVVEADKRSAALALRDEVVKLLR
ncbi:MAG TPA: hypothetical protein DIS75_03265 [Chryseobacterium sp.]|nr:hypothetical protein [Chryseobacterium sp.]